MKVADSMGRVHKSMRESPVGKAGHSKRCSVVCASKSHSGQSGEAAAPIRNRYELSLLQ